MCGVSAAGTNIFQSNGLAGEMFNLIFLPFVLIMIISKSTIGYFKRHIFKAHCITSGVAVFEKNKIAFKVFLDTGNNLRDTVSDLPVILITYEKIKSILPMELKDEYEFKTDENFKAVDFFAMVGEKYANAYWFNRISLLPFCSVGKKQGFIIGFKPHCIQINGKEINAVFGIHMGLFGNGTEFDSIINPLVLEEANNRIKGDKKCLN